MSSSLNKLVPMGSVLGVAAYCLSPFLSPEVSLGKEKVKAKLPRIEATLLAPPTEVLPERNPFEELEAPVVTAAVAGGSEAVAPAEPKRTTVKLPENMVLGATLVHGRRRAAVINGKIYAEGEQVPLSSDTTETDELGGAEARQAEKRVSFRLSRVEHDQVWLDVPVGAKVVPVALVYGERKAPTGATGPGGAVEPGGMEHLSALANSPQLDALRVISQRLFGQDLVGAMAGNVAASLGPEAGGRGSSAYKGPLPMQPGMNDILGAMGVGRAPAAPARRGAR